MNGAIVLMSVIQGEQILTVEDISIFLSCVFHSMATTGSAILNP